MNSTQNMKICLISMHPVAGFRSFLENLSQVLINKGCEVTILSLEKDSSVTISGAKKMIFELSEHQGGNRSYFSGRQMIRRIWAHLSSKRNDAKEELRNNLFHSQIKALCRAKNCNPKLDLTQFDCVISAEEVQCNYFLAYSVIARKKIGYIHPDYSTTPYDRKIDNAVLKELDYICATSKSNAETIKKKLPLLKEKVVGVPNPVDIASIIKKANDSNEITFNNDRANIITVCRLDNTYKALDRLLLVAKKLSEMGDKFTWRIIGWGEYETTMREFIERNGMSENLIMMGAYDNPIPYIKASDLFVLQSYSEGYPMSVCEALAVDTPVLVTNYPSSNEQVEDGITGFIVNNDLESIYQKLHYLLQDPQILKDVKNSLKQYDKTRLANIDTLLNLMR